MTAAYDIAAYVYPAYCDDPRTRMFFPKGIGEWERVMEARPKFPGHNQPRRPLWGYVNEADPRVMEMQIDTAADHGVNVFIYDWYWFDGRPFLEESLNSGFLGARNNHRVKFYLMWANHHGNTIWDINTSHEKHRIWSGAVDRTEFERIGTRLIERYFTHPSYYLIDGKAVLSVFDLHNLISGLGGPEQARDCLDWLSAEARRAGLNGVHVQAIIRGSASADVAGVATAKRTEPPMVQSLGIDSLTHYQWCELSTPQGDYAAYGERAVKEWGPASERFGVPYFPHVSVGWDNNPRFLEPRNDVVTGTNPAAFGEFVTQACQFVEAHGTEPRLITINSWNEWTESSYVQPDLEHGYGYLEAIKSAVRPQGQ